ncbi:secreted RxLR effector protein 161-like [Dioscorea cayenensis subsp. rotundata]|uniref:Secreted RxLR effector protein 161-like n=1 Tax=Dioscorea cayennensis subsp. rotundata TaxID=55577 RepID=A0AB40AWM1_DIOCR|nr:secreted RxLR effector protein 161-like [Dioscorea cayenensis subsp. rotundata]
MCIYVDDIVYMSSSLKMLELFKLDIKMTDLGTLNYFLALEVKQSEDGIFVTQRKYVENILKSFGMQSCKPAATPMNMNDKMQANDGIGKADVWVYRRLIGKLLYLTHTRPDISYAVGILSRFMSNPTKQHLGAGKNLLGYLCGTKNLRLWYSRSMECRLQRYSDSDWGGCIDFRKSTSGMIFNLRTGVVSWGSRKQDITSLSTTEAEYVAVTTAAC